MAGRWGRAKSRREAAGEDSAAALSLSACRSAQPVIARQPFGSFSALYLTYTMKMAAAISNAINELCLAAVASAWRLKYVYLEVEGLDGGWQLLKEGGRKEEA